MKAEELKVGQKFQTVYSDGTVSKSSKEITKITTKQIQFNDNHNNRVGIDTFINYINEGYFKLAE
jgi:hypothetical protein